MDPAWLNRIGIILNFLALFMVSPELIGETLLKRTANLLKRLLSRLLHFLLPESQSVLVVRWILAWGVANIAVTPLFTLLYTFVVSRNPRATITFPLSVVCGFSTGIAGWIMVIVALSASVKVSGILARDAQLRRFLVKPGIILAILGTLLQLWATF